MRYMKPKQLKKLIKKRRKEGIICIPIDVGYMFYNPKNREVKDIWVKNN